MKIKRALQRLQVSANDKNVLVGSPKVSSTEKVSKDSKKVLKASKVVEKENLMSSTRSKRKIISDKQSKATKEITVKKIVKSSKSKPQKSKNVSEVDEKVALNQPTIESFLSSDNIDTNAVEQMCEVESVENNVVNGHINEEAALITSETPSQTYWRNLAEQKRLALQEALLENELLTDQVCVLETENSLIKSALEAAEELLKREGLWD